jgi:tetratricopeptide (TPR) repeat protein/FixJ family two-component response regulator
MGVDLASKTYLVIDDLADMRSMIRSMLVTYGVTNIDMAGNGKDAIKSLSKTRYDVVLCDYNLGEGKDGQQVLEEAKDKGFIQYSTAFLMITAENTMEMVMGAVEHLPDDYLSKPFNKDMLRARLEKVISRKDDLHGIVKLVTKEKYDEAISQCDEKIADSPRNLTELLKLKADLLIKSERYAEATAIFESVLAKRDAPWAMLGLGKVRFHTKEYMQASEIFREIINDNNTNMEAYDWLAKSNLMLGDAREALNVLVAATEISPKSIVRQMELGNLALKENNIDVAVKAFKKAVQVGCNSIYQRPSNYTKLAKIVGKYSGKEALSYLAKLRSDYGRNDETNLEAAIAETLVLKELGREKEAQKAYADANKLYEKCEGALPSDVAMEMANACIVNGDKDRGLLMLQSLVKNNHQDKSVIDHVKDIFVLVGLEEEGQELIRSAIQEVVSLNNTGTQLAKSGKLDEAINFFEKASRNMPDNSTINMNMVNVLLMYMKTNGKSDNYLRRVRQYLERIKRLDPNNENYRKLSVAFEQLVAS